MCTLILGRDVLGTGTMVLAANRDEDPARPSDPPRVLHDDPLVAGGRDRIAGGTWLAVRADAAVALLNRPAALGLGTAPAPDTSPPAAALRSRGLLVLDVATLPTPAGALSTAARERALARAAREYALGAVRSIRYAPLSLVFATAASSWVLAWDGENAAVQDLAPGWHVLTHADLDDREEPRTRRLLRELDGWTPGDFDVARRGLTSRLASHEVPRVCLHEGRAQTVSFALVYLGVPGVRYLHGDGRPCECGAIDHTNLVEERSTSV